MDHPRVRASATEAQQQREKLKHYRTLWIESERVLNILRAEQGVTRNPITDEEVVRWAEKE